MQIPHHSAGCDSLDVGSVDEVVDDIVGDVDLLVDHDSAAAAAAGTAAVVQPDDGVLALDPFAKEVLRVVAGGDGWTLH